MERTFQVCAWKIPEKPITKTISNQLDIKLGLFTQEELDVVLRKIKNRKAAELDEIPQKVGKTRKFDDLLVRYSNTVYNQALQRDGQKAAFFLFSRKMTLKLPRTTEV